jgi:hypothetical protein
MSGQTQTARTMQRVARLFFLSLATILAPISLPIMAATEDAIPTPVLVSARLPRIHGANPVPFDLPLSLNTAAPTIEPRQGSAVNLIFSFDKAVVAATATLLEGTAILGTTTVGGTDVAVTLTGVTDDQYVAVGLTNVAGQDGSTGGSGIVRVGFLIGDVNQSGVVSLADKGLTNAQGSQPASAANFKTDINTSGAITVADIGIVNAKLTGALPPAVCPPPTGAGTLHGTLVPGDHWTVAGNPHIITFDVALNAGTLTLDPCVVVRVREGYNIRIGNNAGGATATITALGTPFLPIVFESEDPTKYWGTLRIYPTGQADLESVTLRHAGNAATAQNYGGALQVLGNGIGTAVTRNARVKNVRIETSATFGLNVQYSGGLTADSAGLVVFDSGRTPGNIAIDTSYPIYVTTPSVNTLPPGQYTGNAKDEILVDNPSSVATDESFRNLGVPYRMRYGFSMSPVLSEFQGGLLTLTIEAGVRIRFLQSPGNIPSFNLGASNGDLPANIWPVRLIANGTLAQPIIFTSAAAVPAAGDWGGIEWHGGPGTGNVVNFVHVEYAGGDSGTAGFGCGPADNDAALIVTNWIPGEDFVQNSTFSNSLAGGIVMGWISDSIRDFKTGNNFTAIGNACAVARWKNKTLPSCPSMPPVCF